MCLSFPCLSEPCCHLTITSIFPTAEISCVVLQPSERIDTSGPGVDLFPDIIGESIIILDPNN